MEQEPDPRIIQLETARRRRQTRPPLGDNLHIREGGQLPTDGKLNIEFAVIGMVAAISDDDLERSTLPQWFKDEMRKIFKPQEDIVLLEGVDVRNNSVCIFIPRRVHAGLYRLLSDENVQQNFLRSRFPEQEDIP